MPLHSKGWNYPGPQAGWNEIFSNYNYLHPQLAHTALQPSAAQHFASQLAAAQVSAQAVAAQAVAAQGSAADLLRPQARNAAAAQASAAQASAPHVFRPEPRRASAPPLSTPQPSAAKPSAAKPLAAKPSAPQQSAARASAPQQSAAKPSAPQPSAPQPSASKPSASQPSAPKASPAQPPASQAPAARASASQSSVSQSSASQSSASQSSAARASAPQNSATQPPAARVSAAQPSAPRSTAARPQAAPASASQASASQAPAPQAPAAAQTSAAQASTSQASATQSQAARPSAARTLAPRTYSDQISTPGPSAPQPSASQPSAPASSAEAAAQSTRLSVVEVPSSDPTVTQALAAQAPRPAANPSGSAPQLLARRRDPSALQPSKRLNWAETELFASPAKVPRTESRQVSQASAPEQPSSDPQEVVSVQGARARTASERLADEVAASADLQRPNKASRTDKDGEKLSLQYLKRLVRTKDEEIRSLRDKHEFRTMQLGKQLKSKELELTSAVHMLSEEKLKRENDKLAWQRDQAQSLAENRELRHSNAQDTSAHRSREKELDDMLREKNKFIGKMQQESAESHRATEEHRRISLKELKTFATEFEKLKELVEQTRGEEEYIALSGAMTKNMEKMLDANSLLETMQKRCFWSAQTATNLFWQHNANQRQIDQLKEEKQRLSDELAMEKRKVAMCMNAATSSLWENARLSQEALQHIYQAQELVAKQDQEKEELKTKHFREYSDMCVENAKQLAELKRESSHSNEAAGNDKNDRTVEAVKRAGAAAYAQALENSKGLSLWMQEQNVALCQLLHSHKVPIFQIQRALRWSQNRPCSWRKDLRHAKSMMDFIEIPSEGDALTACFEKLISELGKLQDPNEKPQSWTVEGVGVKLHAANLHLEAQGWTVGPGRVHSSAQVGAAGENHDGPSRKTTPPSRPYWPNTRPSALASAARNQPTTLRQPATQAPLPVHSAAPNAALNFPAAQHSSLSGQHAAPQPGQNSHHLSSAQSQATPFFPRPSHSAHHAALSSQSQVPQFGASQFHGAQQQFSMPHSQASAANYFHQAQAQMPQFPGAQFMSSQPRASQQPGQQSGGAAEERPSLMGVHRPLDTQAMIMFGWGQMSSNQPPSNQPHMAPEDTWQSWL